MLYDSEDFEREMCRMHEEHAKRMERELERLRKQTVVLDAVRTVVCGVQVVLVVFDIAKRMMGFAVWNAALLAWNLWMPGWLHRRSERRRAEVMALIEAARVSMEDPSD